MDAGINLPFSSVGVDDATFGMPTFSDGWKGLIITGSSQKAIKDNGGGRLILAVTCQYDPTNADTGKQHLISLNLWHNDAAVKARAEAELASIIRAVFGGDRTMNNTAELYNQPFLAKAVTQTPAPTPQYPTPTPQTNWRGYATKDGLGINMVGPAGQLGSGAAGAGGGAGGPPNFNQQQQQAPAQQQQQAAPPQQGGWGGAPAQQAQPPAQQQAPANPGGGWGAAPAQQQQQQAPAQQFQQQAPAQQAPAGGGWGAPAQQQAPAGGAPAAPWGSQ